MLLNILIMLLSLSIILVSCELFTNGVEWLGKKLKVGDGVVGSIFSAVGTCLPETIIPVIAILFSSGTNTSVDIGIGAIMGAPFMLSTLAFFITGASVLIFWKKRKTGFEMYVNNRIIKRDIGFFIVVYTFAVAASLIPQLIIRYSISMFLTFSYIYYIIITVRQDHISHSNPEALYLSRFTNSRPGASAIVLQISLALGGIIFGAHIFVDNIDLISKLLGIPALVLSLIVTPVATELPEKFNSIIWISKRKDTLALGNITGAMVFQSCIPVSIGILATPWNLDNRVILSSLLAMASAAVTYLWVKIKRKLSPLPLLAGGIFYLLFIGYLVLYGFRR